MATSEHAEVERKFESENGASVDLQDVLARVPGLAVDGAVTTVLDAMYFDTDDLALLEWRITLRRREGGDDAGWHLKVPVDGDERREVRLPLGRATRTPPKALLDAVRAYLRDRQVVPVARLHTERTERVLRGAGGESQVVVADDRVCAERLRDGRKLVWSEVEAELVDGDEHDLDVVEKVVREAGLRRSRWPSKLARALGDDAPRTRPRVAPAKAGKRTTAGDVVVAHLEQQLAELLTRDASVRADAPDAVHAMRVATRRLRSALATFRPLFDDARTEALRSELKWLGVRLGGPRDAEVQREGLAELLDRQPSAHVVGPVRRRIAAELNERHSRAHAELVVALDGDRYRRLLARLDRFVTSPPLSAKADRPAREELRRLTANSVRRFDSAARRVDAADSANALDLALHDVRKAAKRARYAADAVEIVDRKNARRLSRRMEEVQEVLGEHQDTVTARLLLRELAGIAHTAGESAFTYGVLHGAEHERGRLARDRYPTALHAVERPSVRRWLS